MEDQLPETPAKPAQELEGSQPCSVRTSMLFTPVRRIETSVDDDALLALERLSEESGAKRWMLFHKVIAGLRMQIAEVQEVVSECKCREAIFEQQLTHERTAREAGHALVRAELQALAQSLQGDLRQVLVEAKASVEGVAAELLHEAKAAETSWRGETQAQLQHFQDTLRDEELARHREHKEVHRCFDELRATIKGEADAHAEAICTANNALGSAESRLATEREERLSAEARAAQALQALQGQLREAGAKQQESLKDLQSKVERAETAAAERDTLQAQRLGEAESALEVKLRERCAQLEARIAECSSLEGRLQHLRGEVSAQEQVSVERDRRVAELAERLKEEREERRVATQQVMVGAVAAAKEAVDREVRELGATLAEHGQTLAGLASSSTQSQAEEKGRSQALEAVRAELAKISQELVEERVARDGVCKQLASSESGNRQELEARVQSLLQAQGEELKGIQEVRLLAERLAGDLRTEQEAAVEGLQKQCLDRIQAVVASVAVQHAALVSEFERTDSDVVNLRETQTAALQDCRAQWEIQLRATLQELKIALHAHGEFAEELEREVRTNTGLLKNVTEGLSQESRERCKLMHCTRNLETDMVKIRGHLPLCFANFR